MSKDFPTWEQAIKLGVRGDLPEKYQKIWDRFASGIGHEYATSDEEIEDATGLVIPEEIHEKFFDWEFDRQMRVTASVFFDYLRLTQTKETL